MQVERLAYAKRWKDAMARSRLLTLASASCGDTATSVCSPEMVRAQSGSVNAETSADLEIDAWETILIFISIIIMYSYDIRIGTALLHKIHITYNRTMQFLNS